jgi:HK97 family phage prohead protease
MMVRADGELSVDDRTVKGYAAVWNIPDSYGTYFVRGAFAKSIQERGPNSNSKYKILMLWQHDRYDPIGQVTVLREDEYGLYFEAVLDDVPSGNRAITQINSGTINQFSFGFNYVWDKVEFNEALGLIEVREVELMEISAVTIGSQQETYAIRTQDETSDLLVELNLRTEQFIKTIPRSQQLELRQLISSHISLRTSEPAKPEAKPLDVREPAAAGIDYEYLSKNLTLFK